jgi:histidinol phosphatase-like PHP family hydrolase/predicted nuclease with RNAse H fold/dephospho-CoA kinase
VKLAEDPQSFSVEQQGIEIDICPSDEASPKIDCWAYARSTEIEDTEFRHYFRLRDFEYAQPLYDLAFMLEIDALSKGAEVPKYRIFSLWRAGYSLDGYGTTIDRWLDGEIGHEDLDYVPSSRIRKYLENIREIGTIPELLSLRGEKYERCLRLRSIRGLGPNKIAATLLPDCSAAEWCRAVAGPDVDIEKVSRAYNGNDSRTWQTAHIVPPLLRFLSKLEKHGIRAAGWQLRGVGDPLKPVVGTVSVAADFLSDSVRTAVDNALKDEKLFSVQSGQTPTNICIRHQMGWVFEFTLESNPAATRTITELMDSLDPLARSQSSDLMADLHLHTAWSDGNASVNAMANAVVASGLRYFAVTDHSRSSKVQGGLTPLLWLRQANALTLAAPVCPVMHGIEVDILKDGALDLPHSILSCADLVVASVHSNWSDDAKTNTDRLIRAIESGDVDVLAHASSAVIGTPGVPDYIREPAKVIWSDVFKHCAAWRVAIEFNSFPSRLDLPLDLLEKAIKAGCAISIGSDSHSRSHLINLRFGAAALRRLASCVVLNRFSYEELRSWIRASRSERQQLPKSNILDQGRFSFEEPLSDQMAAICASIRPPQCIPAGSRIIGIDLTAGDKPTGVALLHGLRVATCSLLSDEDILAYIHQHEPAIVSIDSPLGLPGGGDSIDPEAGIMRVAEHDLASIGIPAYPSLIDSMEKLTLRGIRLRRTLEALPHPPRVIESYPGAAQDILSIPRKQKSLELLREGLQRLGVTGPGLETHSHDEMDAITSAIVGRYFEAGLFEPMGVPSEAQLIVPKVAPLSFDLPPVICLAGRTGAGKSVVARYLSAFYGFEWVRTRTVVRELLIDDAKRPPVDRLFNGTIDPQAITEEDLQRFGALILDEYKQAPLRQKLTELVVHLDKPVVVDSIRDTRDVNPELLANRPLITWFVDCSDAIIRDRLNKKAKLGEKRPVTRSLVDRTAAQVRSNAHHIISNFGSLEDLRWQIDDTLFSRVNLVAR